ncbi:MAG: hypothetical protein GY943_31460, partial [Chloroflexi bacterium]|nr:hypothetical protein [Chloroflexota bacterium]
WPLYILAYGSAIAAMILVFDDLPTLIGVVTFNAGLAILSVWVFRDARWWYPATVLLPAAASLLLIQLQWADLHNFGWSTITLGGIYLFGAWLLTKRQLTQYAPPLLIMSFLFTGAGLLPSLDNTWGILIGFGMATAVYTTMSIWKRQPILLFISAGLATIAYGAAMSLIDIDYDFIGLAMWPGILLVLLTAVY